MLHGDQVSEVDRPLIARLSANRSMWREGAKTNLSIIRREGPRVELGAVRPSSLSPTHPRRLPPARPRSSRSRCIPSGALRRDKGRGRVSSARIEPGSSVSAWRSVHPGFNRPSTSLDGGWGWGCHRTNSNPPSPAPRMAGSHASARQPRTRRNSLDARGAEMDAARSSRPTTTTRSAVRPISCGTHRGFPWESP